MFKQSRAIAFAALAAMVSVSAQAANYRFAWWSMNALAPATSLNADNIDLRTKVLQDANVDMMAAQGLCVKAEGDFENSNGYFLSSRKIATSSSDGAGRAFAYLPEKFSCADGVQGTGNSPKSNNTAGYVHLTDKENGAEFVLLSSPVSPSEKTLPANFKKFYDGLKGTYPNAIFIWGHDAKSAGAVPAAMSALRSQLDDCGFYPMLDTNIEQEESKYQCIYCSSKDVADSAGVAVLTGADTYGTAGYIVDLTVSVQHTVTFLTRDGEQIEAKSCEHGTAVTPPDAPAIDGLEFAGWDPEIDFTCVKADAAVTATYQALGNAHIVDFMDEGGLFDSQTVNDGQCVVPPADDPAKEGYSFAAWTLDGVAYDFTTPVTDDLTLESSYEINRYQVVFRDWDGNPIEDEPQMVDWKTAAVAPTMPPLPENYLFEKWSDDFSCVTQDMEVVAEIVPNRVSVTADNFAEVITSEASALTTFELMEDIALEGWVAVDFRGTLEGNGFTLTTDGATVFSTLHGTVRNLKLEVTAAEVKVPVSRAAFGLLADVVRGGTVEGVSYSVALITRGSGGSGSATLGGLIGIAREGAVIRGCSSDPTVVFRCGSNGTYIGGIVGCAKATEGDALVASIESCTNSATLTVTTSTAAYLGGILGEGEGFLTDKTKGSRLVVSNCVNFGEIGVAETVTLCGASFGGIVGRLIGDTVGGSQGEAQVLGCINFGRVSGCKSSYCGGIAGCAHKVALTFAGCVNRGEIGKGAEDVVAGLVALMSSLMPKASCPVAFSDVANYGSLSASNVVAGIVGRTGGNLNHHIAVSVTNAANYGVRTIFEGGVSGALFGSHSLTYGENSKGSFKPSFVNCFATDADFFGSFGPSDGTKFIAVTTENLISAADEDYTHKAAVTALNEYAAEHDFADWTQGKFDVSNGKTMVYPELTIFCEKPYVDGFMLYVR